MEFIIGTRGSKLALWQAEYVRDRLSAVYPEHSFSLSIIHTKGDKVQDKPLNQIGDKGLFCREIEQALLNGEIDLAVHSMKDMPSQQPDGLCFAQCWKREDNRDALVLRTADSLEQLRQGAVIGTGSRRRGLQLKKIRPDLKLVDIRGNVDTRLRKLETEQLDGIVLAAAGLKRLGLENRITQYLSYDEMLPAPAQGVLAIEVKQSREDILNMVNQLSDEESHLTGMAERAFLSEIGGDCNLPIGAACVVEKGLLHLKAVFGTETTLYFGEGIAASPVEAAKAAAREIRRQMAGTVYLVGGGPGDPELITVKGMRLIEEADCLVYDRLSSPELLRNAKPNCELIYVGKRNRYHAMKQGNINRLLVDKAMVHKTVVRLKGGDVYVFGRGGEEGQVLRECGVPFEVVSGVTSAIAGLASAGIPITHRGVARGFQVFTAHDKDDKLTNLDFASLAKTKDTTVYLMGLTKLEEIVEKLLENGKPSDAPIAVISNATLPNQRVCAGTLDTIREQVSSNPEIVSPTLIVVGEVVRLREILNVMEEKPLFGRKILIPRIENGKPSSLTDGLKKLGAYVREVTVGEVRHISHPFTKEELSRFTWILFTSRNGINSFFHALRNAGLDARSLANAKFAVIGTETAKALEEHGLFADLMPSHYDSDTMTVLLNKTLNGTDCVLYPRATQVDSSLEEVLSQICPVESIPMYENVPVEELTISDEELSGFDSVVYTCASSVRRLTAGCPSAVNIARVYSIGPKCSQAVEKSGVKAYTQSKRATYRSLIDAIKEFGV